jgi:hypothetical protein
MSTLPSGAYFLLHCACRLLKRQSENTYTFETGLFIKGSSPNPMRLANLSLYPDERSQIKKPRRKNIFGAFFIAD